MHNRVVLVRRLRSRPWRIAMFVIANGDDEQTTSCVRGAPEFVGRVAGGRHIAPPGRLRRVGEPLPVHRLQRRIPYSDNRSCLARSDTRVRRSSAARSLLIKVGNLYVERQRRA